MHEFFYQKHSRAYSWDILQFNLRKSLDLDLKNLGLTLSKLDKESKILDELPYWTRIDFMIELDWKSTQTT